ncbi:hypothetical protein QJQ45_007469 [Haematococcus lacustris]|nr:hypothetical protein QJQ45_007469 [Haematococcus lacustris]
MADYDVFDDAELELNAMDTEVARLRIVAQGARRTTLHPVGLGPRVAVVLATQVAAARLVRARQRRRRQPGPVARGRAPISPARTNGGFRRTGDMRRPNWTGSWGRTVGAVELAHLVAEAVVVAAEVAVALAVMAAQLGVVVVQHAAHQS